MYTASYDPFAPGPMSVGVRTIQALDQARNRLFPCEIWYPAEVRKAHGSHGGDNLRDAEARPGSFPLIVFSHSSGGNRLSSTFLCTHLAGHGYVVAAMDHSELVAVDLARREGETARDRAARVDRVIASRVPDVRFLLDFLLVPSRDNGIADIGLDPDRIGLVGHSFGGWTVLATTEVEPWVQSVVALAPGGSSNPRPGILALTLTFDWGRDVPTLYLAAEDDVSIPLKGVIELFYRMPASKRMFILRRADHQHFVDDVEGEHEAIRALRLPDEIAWLPAEMRPIEELSSGEQAHLFTRGLTLAHLDATLRRSDAADRFLAGDVEARLAAVGVDAVAYRP